MGADLSLELLDRLEVAFDRDAPYLFISYSHSDLELVAPFVISLLNRGANIWMDILLNQGADGWIEEAKAHLLSQKCTRTLFFRSPTSLISENVRDELSISKQKHGKESITVVDVLPHDEITVAYDELLVSNTAVRAIRDIVSAEANALLLTDRDGVFSYEKFCRTLSKCGIIPLPAERSPAVRQTPEPPPEEPAPARTETVQAGEKAYPEPKEEKPQGEKPQKVYTTTGDITFTIYGQTYTENQSGMMLTVFREVVRRHPDAVDELIQTLTCASGVDYDNEANRGDEMPSYFRICQTFQLAEAGKQICIGTAYGYPEKLKLIARLFQITGEPYDILEGVELPRPKRPGRPTVGQDKEAPQDAGHSRAGGEITYRVYGATKTGNQSTLMFDIFEAVLSRHPECLDEAAETLTSVSLTDYSGMKRSDPDLPTYFRNCRTFSAGGRICCVGASYGINEKLVQIVKLLSLCGESPEAVEIDGVELPPLPGRPGRRGRRSSSGPVVL